MKIALGQAAGTPGDKKANLGLLEGLASDSARNGADVLILPELFLTGYNIGDATKSLAEPRGGPSAQAVGRIAAATGLAIIYGYPEQGEPGIYNSAAVVDRRGEQIANYRKVHIWGEEESARFLPGHDLEIFNLCGHRFGLQICYDLDFPEMARALAQQGVEVIVALSAINPPYGVVTRHLIPTRAYENQVVVAFVNRPGQEAGLLYLGESCVAGPDGSILASSGPDETLTFVDVELERFAAYRRTHNSAPDRRPDVYGDPPAHARSKDTAARRG